MKHKKRKSQWLKAKLKKKRLRRYLLPVNKCVHLNEKFFGSNFHHMSYNIGIFIPVLLHQHIQHSLKSGVGMVEVNLLAMQFLYGGLGDNFLNNEEINELYLNYLMGDI